MCVCVCVCACVCGCVCVCVCFSLSLSLCMNNVHTHIHTHIHIHTHTHTYTHTHTHTLSLSNGNTNTYLDETSTRRHFNVSCNNLSVGTDAVYIASFLPPPFLSACPPPLPLPPPLAPPFSYPRRPPPRPLIPPDSVRIQQIPKSETRHAYARTLCQTLAALFVQCMLCFLQTPTARCVCNTPSSPTLQQALQS